MRIWRRRDRGRPVDLAISHVSGPVRTGDWTPQRAALVAHWSADGALSRSVRELAEQLRCLQFDVVVISASDTPTRAEELPEGVTVMHRPNSGYDFGSWSSGLSNFPGVRRAREVILANDSMVGPFGSLTPTVERMLRTPCHVWSLTESGQFGWHPQSYFVGYRDGLLDSPDLRAFWTGVREHDDKSHVIHNYELGQGRLLYSGGYSTAVAFPSALWGGSRRRNPTIKDWRALLEAGLPMVKRQLLTEPEVADDSADVITEVHDRFGVDIKEWL